MKTPSMVRTQGDEGATMRVLLAILGVALVAMTACAGLPDENAEGRIRIEAADSVCWSGSMGDSTVEGCGSDEFEIDGMSGIFSANAQKQSDSSEPLTIILYVNGEEVDRATTSAAYGVAQVIND